MLAAVSAKKKIRIAVLPVAGLGTRFFPATKALPKEMLPIVDKPLIQYAVEEAVASGIEYIILVTSEGKDALEDHFDSNPELERILAERGKTEEVEIVRKLSHLATVWSVRQKYPHGLGHAIGCARALVGDEPFAVLLPDDIIDPSPTPLDSASFGFAQDRRDKLRTSPALPPESGLGTGHSIPCLEQLIEVFEAHPGCVLAMREVELGDVERYGILAGEPVAAPARAAWEGRLYRVTHLVEKPTPDEAPSRAAVIGRYVFEPEIFDAIAKTEPGRGGEIQLSDSLMAYARSRPVYAFRFEGTYYDVGTKAGFLRAQVEFGLKHPELGSAFRAYLKSLEP